MKQAIRELAYDALALIALISGLHVWWGSKEHGPSYLGGVGAFLILWGVKVAANGVSKKEKKQ